MFGHGDPLDWARHPRSQVALTQLFNSATRDRQLAPIKEKLIKDGIASSEGSLLFFWNGSKWVKNNGRR